MELHGDELKRIWCLRVKRQGHGRTKYGQTCFLRSPGSRKFSHLKVWKWHKWIFGKLTPNIHWTKIYTSMYFFHPLAAFVPTRGRTSFFLCVLKLKVFHGLDQDLDPNTLSSLISNRGPGPKDKGGTWPMQWMWWWWLSVDTPVICVRSNITSYILFYSCIERFMIAWIFCFFDSLELLGCGHLVVVLVFEAQ